MARSSLNLHPRYSAEDMDSGRPARAIGEALDEFLRRKQEQQSWENDVSMNGGQLDPEGPGVMEKIKNIGGSIRRHLPGYDPAPEAEQYLDANRGRVLNPGIMPSSLNPHTPPFNPAGGRGVALDDGTSPATNVTTMHPGANRSLDTIGTARDGVTRSPIAEEIERTIVRGPNGRGAIMPTTRGRQQMEQRDRLAAADVGNSEWDRRQGIEHGYKMEELKANPRQSLSVADRLAIEDRKGAIAKEKLRLGQQLRSSDPLAAARIRSQIHALELRERSLDQGEERLGTQVDTAILRAKPPETFGNDDPAVTQDAEAVAGAQREAVGRLRSRGRGASGKPKLSQSQYDAGLSKHTDADIEKHYDLSGIRRRK